MGEASARSDSPSKQLTPEQIRRIRIAGLIGSPFRVALALLALSLVGGLPWKLYLTPHGWVLAALVLLKDLAEYIARVPSLTGRIRDRDAFLVWIGVQAPLLVAVASRTYLPELLPRTVPLIAAGAAVAAAGVLLRAWSVRTLGTFFTLAVRVHKEHRVIQHGPYRRVRHPAYSGSLLYLLGVSLALSSAAGIAATLFVALPAVIFRMRREELILRRHLGDEYREYIKRTRRLVPGIY